MTDLKTITIPDLNHAEQSALNELVVQWRSKRNRNNMRSAFYDMKNSSRSLMGNQIPATIKRRAFVLGWSAIAVDKLNRRCNLEGFYEANGFDLDDLGMGQIERDNRLTSEISQAGVSSLIHAVSWIVTTQGDTQSGEAPVLMLGKDATSATGMWSVRRRAVTSFLSITDMDERGEPTAMTMYLPNLNVMMSKGPRGWVVERRTHTFGVPVDPMTYGARLGRRMGRSRISRAVMSIHTQALAAMIRADVNGEAYSLPRFVLLGATEEAFKNADGSPKPAWQAAWDAVWAIGDDSEADEGLERADIKQFTGQSPEPQNAHLRMLAQMFSGETGVPIGELGLIGDANPTSAEALMASRDDIISEAESTTDGWSPDVASAATRALRMLNGDGAVPDDLDVRPRWRSPLHISRAAAADAGSKTIDKVPWLAESEVGLEILGLTPDQIERAMADKRRAQGSMLAQTLAQAARNDLAG